MRKLSSIVLDQKIYLLLALILCHSLISPRYLGYVSFHMVINHGSRQTLEKLCR